MENAISKGINESLQRKSIDISHTMDEQDEKGINMYEQHNIISQSTTQLSKC